MMRSFRKVVRFAIVAAIVCAVVPAIGSVASADTLASALPLCASGDAVAMQIDRDVPIVLTRGGGLVTVGSGSAAMAAVCTTIDGAVGLAIDALGVRFVADRTTVHAFARGAADARGSFAPQLAPGEAIAAIALLPNDRGVELAVISPSAPVRFATYPVASVGTGVPATRSFTGGAFLGPVSAIASDSRGRTYVYDDGGEILVFAANASGAALPVRRFVGSESGLRPAVHATARGSRPLALDQLGSLYAADDGIIVQFPFGDDGQLPESFVFACGARADIGIVRGLATATDGSVDVLDVDPAAHTWHVRRVPFGAAGADCDAAR